MFFRTEFRLKPTEEAVDLKTALGIVSSVPWVKEAAWLDHSLTLSYDPGNTNVLQLIEVIKNTGFEVLSMGPSVEVIEELDQAS